MIGLLDSISVVKEIPPLISAAQLGKAREVSLLLKRGVNPNVRDDSGWSALHWVCQEGYADIVKILLKFGAANDPLDKIGFTPLLLAVGEGHEKIVRLLIKAGAHVNRKCKSNGYGAPLSLAASWDRIKVARELIRAGANVNAKDSAGRTPLFFAVMHAHFNMTKFLIDSGAVVDLHFKDSDEKKSMLDFTKGSRNSRMRNLLRNSVLQE